ncbi:MAG TPA: hypothetical protein VFE53_17655 [Mucilaginibacter sp.]|jgi:hypothetical protein|nr:hypothetical protein [Mucilaginibacter sp.]
MYDIGDYSFDSLVEALSDKLNITPASAFNLISGEADVKISDLLDVVPAAVDCLMNGEAHIALSDRFGMTNADLDNLIKHYGQGLSVGLIIGYLIGKSDKKIK